MPAVTIGLPFRNAEASLADAIRSVFAQTFDDWELVLVDDGSTDASLTIAKSVDDPRVRVVSDGNHHKLPWRLNQIVDLAQSPLVARLDADDMLHPDRIQKQVHYLQDHPSCDIVGTSMFALDEKGALMGVAAEGPPSKTPLALLRRGLIAHATILARRDWLRAHRYDDAFPRAEDRELFCRSFGEARVAQLTEPLYFQTHRKSEIETLRDYVASSRDNRRIFRRHAPRLVGSLATIALVAESFAKEAVFRTLTTTGTQGALIRRRCRRATLSESQQAEETLAAINATSVPGWNRDA